MKKIYALFLTVCMLFSVGMVWIPAQASSPHYLVPSDAETVTLEGVEYNVVRTSEDFLGMTEGKYLLGADINLNGETFSAAPVSITGDFVLEGNGYAVLGFSVVSESHASLFGFAADAEVSALVIRNLQIGSESEKVTVSSSGNASVGVLFGVMSQDCAVTIENTDVYADVSCSSNNSRVGGLIGGATSESNQNWQIANCRVWGSIRGNYGNVSRAGGIAGDLENKTVVIQNCVNYASVENFRYAGGIIGYYVADWESDFSCQLESCINYGTVGATGSEAFSAHGGVAGMLAYVAGAVTLSNCLNAGNLTGVDHSGGMIASAYNVTVRLERCANIGKITVTADAAKNAGGMVGYLASANVSAKYYFKDCACFGILTTQSDSASAYMLVEPVTGKNRKDTIKECTGNQYIAQGESVLLDNTSAQDAVDVQTAVTVLQERYPQLKFEATESQSDAFIRISDTGKEGVPRLVGVQNTAVASDQTQNIRFVAALDSLDCHSAGFEITVSYTDPSSQTLKTASKTVYAQYVFHTLLGMEGGEPVTYTAEQLGGSYLMALTVNEVPANIGTVTFSVRAFADDSYDSVCTVIYENGVFVHAQRQ